MIRRYNPFLYKVGRTYGYNHHDTEDMMQETYINAFLGLNKFENRSAFKTWLVRIMLNHCYHKKRMNDLRKNTISENGWQEHTEPQFYYENNIMNKELGHIIEGALARIPEDYRIIFTFRELNGSSVTETAEAFNISENNVKVRLNRAKKMLRTELTKMYSLEDAFEFNLVHCNSIVDNVMERIKNIGVTHFSDTQVLH